MPTEGRILTTADVSGGNPVRTVVQSTQANDEVSASNKDTQVFVLGDPNTPANLAAVRSDGSVNVNLAATAGGGSQVGATLTASAASTLAGISPTTGSWIIDVGSAGNASFHLLTSAFVGTVVFEQSFDSNGSSGSWAPVPCLPEDAGSPPVSSLSINTAVAYIRQFTQGMFGPKWFRVRVSAFTSGTLAVLGSAGPGWVEGQPALAPSNSVIGSLRGADLGVTATAAASAAVTLTLPAAGAGLFHYITAIKIQRYAAAALTGAAAPVVVTSTNLPGSPAWSVDTVGAIGTGHLQYETYPAALKSSVANTATTIVAPVYTNAIWRMSASYYTGV